MLRVGTYNFYFICHMNNFTQNHKNGRYLLIILSFIGTLAKLVLESSKKEYVQIEYMLYFICNFKKKCFCPWSKLKL